MAFADNNNTLYETVLKTGDNKEMKFSLLENKKRGTINASIREFKTTEAYSGPTKNGLFLTIDTVDDIEKIQTTLNKFFEECKKYL